MTIKEGYFSDDGTEPKIPGAKKKESQQKNNNSCIEKNRNTIKGQFSWREAGLYHHMK